MKKRDLQDLAIIVIIGDYHQKVGDWPTIEMVWDILKSYNLGISDKLFKRKCKKLAELRFIEFLYDDISKPPKWLILTPQVEDSLELYRKEFKKRIKEREDAR